MVTEILFLCFSYVFIFCYAFILACFIPYPILWWIWLVLGIIFLLGLFFSFDNLP